MDNGAGSYRRFLDGDESAFDEILELYRLKLTYFIDRIVRDTAAAEDIAIDVFTELLIRPYRYNFKTSLKTYLFMIGRSKALDYIKHRDKFTITELSDENITDSDRQYLVGQLISDEEKRALNDALEKLPSEMRLAVHLVYFEEMSYKEAAVVMKKRVKQVDNLLYRAKAELRSLLGEEGFTK